MLNCPSHRLLAYITIAICTTAELACRCAWAQNEVVRGDLKLVRVQGTVTDAQGKPLEGAVVLAEQIPFPGSPKHKFTSVETSASGSYQLKLTLIPRESVLIRAYKAGFAIGQPTVTAAQILLGEKSLASHNFTLAPPQRLRFQLTDANGQAVAGASLATISDSKQSNMAYPWQLSEVIHRLGLELPKSDANGICEIPWLSAEGIYQVGFDHPEFARGMHWTAKASQMPLQVHMERGQELEFAFECLQYPEAVRDAQAIVFVNHDKGSIQMVVPVDEHGRGKVRVVNGRHTLLTPVHPTLATTGPESYPGRGLMTFSLYAKATVRGRVLNSLDGQGVAGIAVQVTLQAKRNSSVTSARTAADGRYSVSVPATSLVVKLSEINRDWKIDEVVQVVEPKMGEVYELDDFFVRPRLPLRGQVLFEGQPVPQAILFEQFSSTGAILADAQGRFELRSQPFLVSKSIVIAMHPHKRLSIVVPAAKEQQDLLIPLLPEGSLVGSVVDSKGRPLAGQWVDLQTQFDTGNGSFLSFAWQSTQSREDGTFRFQGLSEGFKYRAALKVKDDSERRKVFSATEQWKAASQLTSRRSPLVASEAIDIEKKEQMAFEKTTMPSKLPRSLVEGKFTKLKNSSPLSAQDFDGRLVVLCYNVIRPELLEMLEQIHQLYSPQLTVIAVFSEDFQNEEKQLEDFLKDKSLSFHLAIDDGSLAQVISNKLVNLCAIYGPASLRTEEFKLSRENTWLLPIVRNAIVYKR